MVALTNVCLLLLFLYHVNAKFDVLKREPGFVYKGGSNSTVKLEVFVDLMCSDSLTVYSELIQLANDYGPENLELKFQIFPLPYFRNSHKATKATFIIEELSQGRQTNNWIELVFNSFSELTNSATNNLTEMEVISKFADLAEELGINRIAFQNKLAANGQAEKSARMVHRYGSSRAVLSVPEFYINGFKVPASHRWKVAQFKTEIDKLLG